MKLLIAGGAGYIGSVLCPLLAARGHDVTVVDLCWFGNYLPDNIHLVRRDVCDLEAEDLHEYEQVLFLAGLSNDPMADYDARSNFHHNTAAPIYLCRIAKEAGVRRFIFASTCSIYGWIPGHVSTEDMSPDCSYPYGQSKRFGETSCLTFQSPDYSVIALRKGTVSGPSPRMRFDLIVNTMYRAAVTKGRVTVNMPGVWRPILDIGSACQAYLRAIEAAYEISGVFNIADSNYTVGGVADAVAAEIHGCGIVEDENAIPSRAALRNYAVSTEQAQVVLGWRPRTDGVGGIVRRLMAHDYGDLYDPRYNNLATWKAVRGADES